MIVLFVGMINQQPNMIGSISILSLISVLSIVCLAMNSILSFRFLLSLVVLSLIHCVV